MLIPIGDDNRDRRSFPFLTYLLIAVNVLVFVFFQGLGSNDRFTYAYSMVPEEILTGRDVVTADRAVRDPRTGQVFQVPGLGLTPVPIYLTVLTSMFMHGGFAHLLGNMLYLFIFGDNIEDRLGRRRFLLFYLLCGALAALAHVFAAQTLGQNLQVPTLGASGAISGVLAGYLVLFPRKRVTVIMIRFITRVPAVVVIGVWFLFQLISGMGMLGGMQGGGVAYAAHIGGFLAGLILIKPFDPGAGRAPARRYGS